MKVLFFIPVCNLGEKEDVHTYTHTYICIYKHHTQRHLSPRYAQSLVCIIMPRWLTATEHLCD